MEGRHADGSALYHNLLHINVVGAMYPSERLTGESPTGMRTSPPQNDRTWICYASFWGAYSSQPVMSVSLGSEAE